MSEPNHSKSKRIGLTFRRCGIGVAGKSGWIVLYGGNILGILEDGDKGEVALAVGFERPYINIGLSWASLTDAKADFSGMARLYRMGIPSTVIDKAVYFSRCLK